MARRDGGRRAAPCSTVVPLRLMPPTFVPMDPEHRRQVVNALTEIVRPLVLAQLRSRGDSSRKAA